MSFFICDWLSVSVNSTVSLKPLAFSTSLYNGAAFSNSSLDESLDTLRLKLLCNCHFFNFSAFSKIDYHVLFTVTCHGSMFDIEIVMPMML